MYERQIPVGKLKATITELLNPVSPDLKSIPAEGILLKPGDTVWMNPTDCPIVFAAARDFMLVAHAGNNVVTTVFKTLLGLGVLADEIVMCIQQLPPALESNYIDKAIEIGIRQVWAEPENKTDHNPILIERTA